MFGIFKKSKIVRTSEDNTKTTWFNGQKVKIKSGSSSVKTKNNKKPNEKNPRSNFKLDNTKSKKIPDK